MQAFYASKLIKHGFWAMIVALVGGFLLAFSMIGGVSLSPVPIMFEFELPGTARGWRILHLGMLMNGIMAIVIGVAMNQFYLPTVKAFRVYAGSAIAVWGNFCFYLFGMFAANHGLTVEANRLGEGGLAAAAAYFPAILGAVTLMYACAIMAKAEPKGSSVAETE